jgi:hypothetical protein
MIDKASGPLEVPQITPFPSMTSVATLVGDIATTDTQTIPLTGRQDEAQSLVLDVEATLVALSRTGV